MDNEFKFLKFNLIINSNISELLTNKLKLDYSKVKLILDEDFNPLLYLIN